MKWLSIDQMDEVNSPGLLVDADRVAGNIRQMVEMVGGASRVDRLRPHVKTHKMAEVVRLQRDAGLRKFKAATIAEAELVASTGPADILLAYQPVGPNLRRLTDLVRRFPDSSFASVVDDPAVVRALAGALAESRVPAGAGEPVGSEPGRNAMRLFIDVDCGMHRTGIAWGEGLDALRAVIESTEGVSFAGLHVYDGHIHSPGAGEREDLAGAIIDAARQYIERSGCPTIIGGGSPTFGYWARATDWECSPGTPLLWDIGYGMPHPELPFLVAAGLATRVISKPGAGRLCFDLGHKSVASEMPLAERVVLPDFPDATLVGHSEEHLVVETSRAGDVSLGDAFIGYPRHICPSVAVHAYANVIRDGKVTGEIWRVAARDR